MHVKPDTDHCMGLMVVSGWALDGGSPMSHVEFKKWLCQLSLIFNFHVDLEMVSCRMWNLRNGLCHVDNLFLMLISSMSHVNSKKWPLRPVEFKERCWWLSICICLRPSSNAKTIFQI